MRLFARYAVIAGALSVALLGVRAIAGFERAVTIAPAAQDDGDSVTFTPREVNQILSHRLPAPPDDPTNRWTDDPRAAAFGQHLFFETRFSRNGEISCATCHVPDLAFTDGRPVAVGLAPLDRNTPSVLNAAYRRWLFWDGRADSLWMQAVEPFEHAREYDGDRTAIIRTVAQDEAMRRAYETIFGALPEVNDASRFPDEARPVPANKKHPAHQAWEAMAEDDREAINRAFTNLGKAIAAYERQLIVRNAPFDRFAAAMAEGDAERAEEFMSPAARRGLKLFLGPANCRACHFGPNFTDEEFHNNGVPPLTGGPPNDAGRYEGLSKLLGHPFTAAGRYSDDPGSEAGQRTLRLRRNSETWGQMKTPSLRNIAESAPYMHAGQFESLEAVVRFYSTLEGQVQAGHHRETILQPLNLTEQEIRDLVAFLEALTGSVDDPSLLKAPDRPLPAVLEADDN